MASLKSASCKSFCYLSKNDFVLAFGIDETVLVAKDYKRIKFNFDCRNETQIKQSALRDVHIQGDVIRPVQLKMVNTGIKESDANLLFCFDEMASDEESEKPKKQTVKKAIKRCATGRSLNVNLFRRRMKCKKFIELDEAEREQIATTALTHDKYRNKSLFYFINDKQLVLPSDYTEPDFIILAAPPDKDYEENYSSQAPSVHDLFDIDVYPLAGSPPTPEASEPAEDYEMLEYLEEEEL